MLNVSIDRVFNCLGVLYGNARKQECAGDELQHTEQFCRNIENADRG